MLHGIVPVIPTPFSENGEQVLYESFSNVVDLAVREGAGCVMLFGAGGEFYKLNDTEKNTLLREALQVCEGRAQVAVTVTPHATLQARRETERYQDMGASLVNIMPPSFAAPSGRMVMEHIIGVAKSVRVPLMLQYAPALTGVLIPNEVFAEIAAQVKGELYIKVEATPTGPAITALLNATQNRCKVVIGNAGECLYEAWERGAAAVLAGAAMVKPYADITAAFSRGDRETAWQMYRDFLPYLHFIHRHIEEFVFMEKTVLHWRGILPAAVCRAPFMRPDEVSLALLRRVYDEAVMRFYQK